MAKLVWDQTGEHFYETGVKQVVLYPMTGNAYGTGVAWNGVTSIEENPSGADFNPIYADDIKYLNIQGAEEFGATIGAYTYPDEFAECDGAATPVSGVAVGQQARKSFGLCYRTTIGNDTEGIEYGYTINSNTDAAQIMDGRLCPAAGKRAYGQSVVPGERYHAEDFLLQIESPA